MNSLETKLPPILTTVEQDTHNSLFTVKVIYTRPSKYSHGIRECATDYSNAICANKISENFTQFCCLFICCF